MSKVIQESISDDSIREASVLKAVWRRLAGKTPLTWAFLIALSVAVFSPLALQANPQQVEEPQAISPEGPDDKPAGKVIGLKYNCVHVLDLEKTLKLYSEILGYKKVGEEVLHGKGIEGMVVMKYGANGHMIHLSLPAKEYADTVGPVGNTNHNHFMLLVDNIVPICDRLKQEGYKLENEAYARNKYSFFTGPNGEIVGLTEYK